MYKLLVFRVVRNGAGCDRVLEAISPALSKLGSAMSLGARGRPCEDYSLNPKPYLTLQHPGIG